MTTAREVWITGIGLVSCLGEGLDAHWAKLCSGDPPPYDDKTFAPFIVHPLAPVNFDLQIPRKGDQRQMELWQRIGVYTAGLALADAGLAGKADLLDRTDMIVSAGGGERDLAVDGAILSGIRSAAEPEAFLNERLMNDLRPTLFLAQLPNLLAGNISIVHGVVGSSRTFMGEEAAGVDALRLAQARVAAGQSDVTLVGGAYHGTRWDMLILYELGGVALKDRFAPVWDRGPVGGVALASAGAFLVIEGRDHAEARGARPLGRFGAVLSDRNLRRPGESEATQRAQWDRIAPALDGARAAVISGASGVGPATEAERRVLAGRGLPVRAVGTHIGHNFEAQFLASVAIACETVRRGALFAPAGSGDLGATPPAGVTQAVVTGVGHWRGEGLALVERAG